MYRLIDLLCLNAGGLKTRFAHVSAPFAVVLLLLIGLAVAASIGVRPTAPKTIDAPSKITDLSLYQSLAAQVLAGRNYYVAATETQRELGYPVRPVVTVRPPTLTWLIVALSPRGAHLLLQILVAATTLAWAVRLTHLLPSPPWWIAGGILIGSGLAPATSEPMMWFSETWAGVLIALSLAIRSPCAWWPSMAAALAAVLIRELALPYLVAMGLLAAFGGQRREAIGWGVAVGLFVLAFLFHAQAIEALIQSGDPVSPGWNGHGGWRFFLAACREMTVLGEPPSLVTAFLLPLVYVGLVASPTAVAFRLFVTLAGYTLLLTIFARQNNAYWILMISPILSLGLLFVPFAIADLLRSLLRRSQPRRRGHSIRHFIKNFFKSLTE